MNILVLSDLHIDNGDTFGTFQWEEKDFILQLERIIYLYNIDKVIFNGDIFELMKYRMEDIRNAYPVLFRYLKNRKFIFIKGNHDLVSSMGALSFDILNSSGQRIHIEHGHNADWFNGSKPGRAIGQLGLSVLKKLAASKTFLDIYFRIIALEEAVDYIPKKYNTIKYLVYALKLLKEYDLVILAHTHKIESHHTYYLNRKKRYLNCGSCSLGRFEGIVLDTETFKYELIKETSHSLKEKLVLDYAV